MIEKTQRQQETSFKEKKTHLIRGDFQTVWEGNTVPALCEFMEIW